MKGKTRSKEKKVSKGKSSYKVQVRSDDFTYSKDDLNYRTAYNAHRNTSFTPDKRAEMEQQQYVEDMRSMEASVKKYVRNEEQKAIMIEELKKYQSSYLEKKNDLLYRRSGIASVMITGGSNFPVERMKKRNEIDHRKTGEYLDWKKKQKAVIRRAVNKKLSESEKQSDLEAVISKDLKIASTKEFRGEKVPLYMRNGAKNRIVGKVQTLVRNGQTEEVDKILKMIEKSEKKEGVVVFTKRHKIWGYSKKAEVMQERISARPTTGSKKLLTFNGGSVINNYEDERVQIIFDEKPSSKVLSDLNGSGWRWTPSKGVWQRKNTKNAEYSANRIIKDNYGDS